MGEIRAVPDGIGATGNAIPFPRGRILTVAFDDRSFLLTRSTGAFAVFVWNPAARTRRGVAIGDDLESVRRRYPGARCGREVEDDGPDTFPSCTVRVGRRIVTFAKDPIESFTLGQGRRVSP